MVKKIYKFIVHIQSCATKMAFWSTVDCMDDNNNELENSYSLVTLKQVIEKHRIYTVCTVYI